LKQRRLDSTSASYYFPMPDEKKKAKIDIYQHVGTCSVPVDPDFRTSDEVTVACADPEAKGIRLRVTSQAKQLSQSEEAERRETLEKETKDSAIGYLASHGIEQKLSESIRLLLKMQPSDPVEFICNQLKSSTLAAPQSHEKVVPPPVSSEPPRTWSTAAAFDLQNLGPADLCEAERVLSKALIDLEGDVAGTYMPLPTSQTWPLQPGGMTNEQRSKLAAYGLLFEHDEPNGRGIFLTSAEDVAVWVNAERHVQILTKFGTAEVASRAERLRQTITEKNTTAGYAPIL